MNKIKQKHFKNEELGFFTAIGAISRCREVALKAAKDPNPTWELAQSAVKNRSSSRPSRPSLSFVAQECATKLTFGLLCSENPNYNSDSRNKACDLFF
jgi:hypothetical protein